MKISPINEPDIDAFSVCVKRTVASDHSMEAIEWNGHYSSGYKALSSQ